MAVKTVSKQDPEYQGAWPSPGYTEREQATLDALMERRNVLAAQLLSATDDAVKRELEAEVSKLDREFQARAFLDRL